MTPDELRAIGQQLASVRLERDLSVAEVSQATRIRARFIEAMEAGQVDPDVTELQLRGFLRNYATFLGLDLDAMLFAYQQSARKRPRGIFGWVIRRADADADTAPQMPVLPLNKSGVIDTPSRPIAPVISPSYAPPPTTSPRRWNMVLWFLLFSSLLGVAAAIILVVNPFASDSDDAISDVLPTLTPMPSPTIVDNTGKSDAPAVVATPTNTPRPTQGADGIVLPNPNQVNLANADGVTINVNAVQRSWVRVTVDGSVDDGYEGLLRPGTAINFTADESIELRTSNAGGIQVVVNNQDLGSLGERGELYEQVFSLESGSLPSGGSQTTEATFTPSPAVDASFGEENLENPAPLLPDATAAPQNQ